MADTELAVDRDSFSCSICLDLLKDPVTLPCGHSYCMSCINTHWDGEVSKKSYSCPHCRHCFVLRPGLVKNTMLAVLMEGLKKNAAPAASQTPSAAHGHVFCDLCSGTKVKAEKSCLQCLVSYCKEHLQPHYDVPALKRHKLAEPIENLQENMCSVHDEVMKMFCRTDQKFICYLCSMDEHKGHHTVTAAAERTEKQRELQTFHQNILQRIEHKEKDLDVLQHHLKNSSRSADAAVEHSEKSLKELLQLLDERMSFLRQQIRFKQEAEEHRVKELQDKVQQDISELKRKLTELDTLSHTEDHVHFLHKFASLSKVSETSESVNSSQSPPPFQDMVSASVSKLSRSLQDTSLLDPPAVSNKPQVTTAKTDAPPAGAQGTAASQQRQKQPQPLQVSVVPLPTFGAPSSLDLSKAPKVPEKVEFLPPPRHYLKEKPPPVSPYWKLKNHSRKLRWDPRSLYDHLELSEENCLIRHMSRSQNHRHHQLRFTQVPQAVTKETLNGQCYFEMNVFIPNDTKITVAVAYKDMRRDGTSDECRFGMNEKSWALECHRDHSVFLHNGTRVFVPKAGILVGVFVDYRAGILSFYRHWHDLDIIYSVKTTFTQPLVAGARFDDVGGEGKFIKRPY